jgi:Txe/YoeB family toxin of Txe-Axe toxin-antitoxin module
MYMGTQPEAESVVRYQFQCDDELWEDWKMTVPRNKSLETRINELIEADKNGNVNDDGD